MGQITISGKFYIGNHININGNQIIVDGTNVASNIK
jgi:hypothetical protein